MEDQQQQIFPLYNANVYLWEGYGPIQTGINVAAGVDRTRLRTKATATYIELRISL